MTQSRGWACDLLAKQTQLNQNKVFFFPAKIAQPSRHHVQLGTHQHYYQLLVITVSRENTKVLCWLPSELVTGLSRTEESRMQPSAFCLWPSSLHILFLVSISISSVYFFLNLYLFVMKSLLNNKNQSSWIFFLSVQNVSGLKTSYRKFKFALNSRSSC